MTLTAGNVKNSAAIILVITSLLQIIPLFFSNSHSNNNSSFGSLTRFEKTVILIPLFFDLILITYVLLVIMNFFNLSKRKIVSLGIFFVSSLGIRLISLDLLADRFFGTMILLDEYQYSLFWITIISAVIFIPILIFLDTVAFIVLYPKGISPQRQVIFHILAIISLIFSVLTGFVFVFPVFVSLLFYSVKFVARYGNRRNWGKDKR